MSEVKTAEQASAQINADHADFDKNLAAGNFEAAQADVEDASDLMDKFGLDSNGQSVETNGAWDGEGDADQDALGGDDGEGDEDIEAELEAILDDGIEIDC